MEMIVLRLKMARISPTFKAVLNEFKQGIGYYDGITMEQAYSNYRQVRSEYADLFDEKYPQVFENYLVNYVFSKVYPLEPSKNVFDNYIRLVVDYAITRLFLTGAGVYHKKYDDNIVQRVFTGIALTVDHNPDYVDTVVKNIQKLSGGILPYTALLIQI
jgi:lysine-N-methylase